MRDGAVRGLSEEILELMPHMAMPMSNNCANTPKALNHAFFCFIADMVLTQQKPAKAGNLLSDFC